MSSILVVRRFIAVETHLRQSGDGYRVDDEPPGATPYEAKKVELRRNQAAASP